MEKNDVLVQEGTGYVPRIVDKFNGRREKLGEGKLGSIDLGHDLVSRKIMKLKRIRKNSFKIKKKRKIRTNDVCDSTGDHLHKEGKIDVPQSEVAEDEADNSAELLRIDTAQEVSNSASVPHRSDSNTNSLLDEILSEKKMALLASPEVVKFLRAHVSNKNY